MDVACLHHSKRPKRLGNQIVPTMCHHNSDRSFQCIPRAFRIRVTRWGVRSREGALSSNFSAKELQIFRYETRTVVREPFIDDTWSESVCHSAFVISLKRLQCEGDLVRTRAFHEIDSGYLRSAVEEVDRVLKTLRAFWVWPRYIRAYAFSKMSVLSRHAAHLRDWFLRGVEHACFAGLRIMTNPFGAK